MPVPKRFALVGTGGRCAMFLNAIASTYADQAVLVGLCDISRIRMNYWTNKLQADHGLEPVACYHADDFDKMVAETKPDTIIVTTMDSTHHLYIIRAMELGCDVVVEKPMTIDEEKAQLILDTQARTGRNVRVTFNYRYMPTFTKVRELIRDGVIGKPLLVDFMWTLNTSHGADYFRRWHREKDKSGGLLVHKATHHFDLVNFLIQSKPQTVVSLGDLKFYGKDNAAGRGETYSYTRYTGEPAAKNDPFALFIDEEGSSGKGIYYDGEKDSGYIRDRNVFGENISAEDTMGVLCRYENGVQLHYSLVAYSPWEGYRLAITGTKGRIELDERHGAHVILGQSDEELTKAQSRGKDQKLTVFPMFKPSYEVEIPTAEGGHGGGDKIILDQIFATHPQPDPFNRGATHVDGAASILLGIAANHSIKAGGQPVDVASLVNFAEPATV